MNNESKRKADAHPVKSVEAGPPSSFMAGPARMPKPDTQFPTSERIGRYKLLQQIGEGGFGVVYMAEQEQPVRRRVALKIIKPGMDTKQVIGRFEAERQALAMLDHPNIARVLDAGATDQGRPYFVMELVKGERITDFCDTNRLDITQRLELFVDVCNAIQHAHQKGIIHRDIKPSNVLVTMHDDRPIPKVIDFGIAKATEQRLTERTVFTEFRQLIGTPAYMSPEQASFNGRDVDTRSDVYSLGVLLYELMSGVPPFDEHELRERGFEELCRVIRESAPPIPSSRVSTLGEQSASVSRNRSSNVDSLRSRLQGEVDWIVMKSLEKDRSRRYESANALTADIKRFLANEPVLAGPPSAIYQFRKFIQRHRAASLSALAIAASLLMGTIMASVGMWKAVASAERETQRATELRRSLYVSEMSAAKREIDEFSTAIASQILTKHIPGPDETDLRGFEWRWLWNQCHREVFEFTGGPIHDTRSGGAPFRDMRISPNGKWLATGAADGHVRLWSMETKKHLWSFKGFWHCNCVDFSPDSKLLLASFERDFGANPVRTNIWILEEGKTPSELIVMERLCEQPCGTRFLPDGSGLVSDDGAEFDLSGKKTREKYIDPLPGTDEIWMRHYSADRSIAASKDRIWDVANGRLVKRLPVHDGHWDQGPMGVAISPDDPVQIATASAQGIRIWDRDGNLLKQVTGTTDKPFGWLSFSRDGRLMAARQFTGAVKIFETETWTEIDVFPVPASDNSVMFSPLDETLLLAGGSNGVIRGYSVSPKDKPDVTFDFPSAITCLNFSPDGKLLAVRGGNGEVIFWDVQHRSTVHTTNSNPHHEGQRKSDRVTGSITFSPDSRFVAMIGPRDTVTVWDVGDWEIAASCTNDWDTRPFWTLCFSKDGRHLYGGDFWKIMEWEWPASSEEFRPRILQESFGVKVLDTSHGDLVAAAGQDTNIWSASDWQSRFKRTNGVAKWYGDSNDLAFSPVDKQLAIASGGVIELFDMPTTTPIGRLTHSAEIDHLEWSPDATRLVASDRGGTTRIWDVETRQSVASFTGYVSAFSPDGTIIAIGRRLSQANRAQTSSRVTLYYAPPLSEIEATHAFKAVQTR